jgi:hypothetical protein
MKPALWSTISFFADGLALRLREATQCLLDKFDFGVNIEGMLRKFSGNT